MTRTRSTAAERLAWADDLRATLPPGSTAYTILRHVSASGMTRDIDVYALAPDEGDPSRVNRFWLSYRVAAILGESMQNDAVRVTGAGMDMGFHIVYALSRRLYPDGFDCAGERCPSNDHSNGMPRFDPTPDAGGWIAGRVRHADGGYAIRQEWL